MSESRSQALRQLAGLYEVQAAYRDAFAARRVPPQETLVRILRSLGAPLSSAAEAPEALRVRREELWMQRVEPVTALIHGARASLTLRLSALLVHGSLELTILEEEGERRHRTHRLADLSVQGRDHVEGKDYMSLQLPLPDDLPIGYHNARVTLANQTTETLLLVAPPRAYPDRPDLAQQKLWGVFLPLYALHSERSWGSSDFTDLQRLMEEVAGLGGDMVATLPLLASFMETPFEPSPYAPASRLFWNELYVDPVRSPDFSGSKTARTLLESRDFQSEIAELQKRPYVDYRQQMQCKRRVVEALAQSFAAMPDTGKRKQAFKHFLRHDPQVEDYARFRAACEHFGGPWPTWPQRPRSGRLEPRDYDQRVVDYHLYAQWLAHDQLTALSHKGRELGQGLYLDLPLGVAYDSYDVWRERSIFALDMSAGAPPDPFFTGGQNWGFPPLHPARLRQSGYRHVIHFLRNHLEYAGVLRIDHVMMLHRLFWIPQGEDAAAGAYVRYRADELYAILKIESHRHQAYIIGENLGTVPAYVNRDMGRHNIQRMYVLQYEAQPDKTVPLRPVPRDAAASLNTHDMPPFAAYWAGADVADRVDLGLLDEKGAGTENDRRRETRRALTGYLQSGGWLQDGREKENMAIPALKWLAAGDARLVLINVEDLWRELQPQNVPGTTEERPNWRRKARYTLEEMVSMPEVKETLQQVDRLRKGE